MAQLRGCTMDITSLLNDVASGQLDAGEAERRLRAWPGDDMGFAHLDNHRDWRTGFIEVVYCASKSPEQVTGILKRQAENQRVLLGTRAESTHATMACQSIPELEYFPEARILRRLDPTRHADAAPIAVVSAGTSDLAVAEEAALTIETVGHTPLRKYDVGVAGLHRIASCREELERCGAVIVVAGMEGALPSVVSGMVSRPVIAVPTSVGYGVSFNGLAALLGMLAGCAPGVSVVNIDNGFGAAIAACRANTPV
jgi:NCAIR mutase (PurE)-related protein